MEEQVITQKQFKTLKTTNGFLLAIFIIYIITFAMSGLGILIAVFIQPQSAGALIGFIPMAVEIALVALLLFNKQAERKIIIAVGMLVNSIVFTGMSVYSLFVITPAYGSAFSNYGLQNAFSDQSGNGMLLYNIGCIFYIASGVIIVLFSILLLRKTKGEKVASLPFKLLFILFAVFQFLYVYLTMFAIVPSNIPFYVPIMITVCITTGLMAALMLVPQFVLYKALSDESFYNNFIVVHPNKAIRQYDAAARKPAAKPEVAMYCMNCGAALAPGANFCRQCGNPVNTQK
jgi:hypothetical protein